jgi:acetolactate synthase-1/2/3 large subunit
MPQVAMAAGVTKASWRVEDPAMLGRDVRRALALAAAGRPGPVHLALPDDVLRAEVTATAPPPPPEPEPELPDAAVAAVLEAL